MKLLLLSFLLAAQVFAAGRVDQSIGRLGTTDTWVVIFEWVGDASTGDVPSTAARLSTTTTNNRDFQGYVVVGAAFSPGSPAPTSLYDVTITDGNGVDLLGGGGVDLSSTVASSTAASPNAMPINGTFTLNLSGNSVASATGRVTVYFSKPGTQFAGLMQLTRINTNGGTAGQAIVVSSDGKAQWGSVGGGTPAFSSITNGTAASKAFVIGNGSSLTYTGTGVVDANEILGTALTSITGLTKMSAGVPSAAIPGTDYLVPGGALGTPSSATLTNATGLPLNGLSGLGAGMATFMGTPSSSNFAAAITDETGSGAVVLATSPSLVAPNLGTPSAVNLTNGTALPLGSGVTGTLPGANMATMSGDSGSGGVKGAAPAPAAGDSAAGKFLKADATWAVPPGGSPGGANKYCQFNDSGAFGGDSGCQFDKTTKTLTVTGGIVTGSGTESQLLELKELTANGSNWFRMYGADSMSSDGCIIVSGQPTTQHHVLAHSGSTATTTDGATCPVMTWEAPTGTGGGGSGGISTTLTLDFPSIVDGGCSELTGTLTGLAAGDQLSLGLPAAVNAGFVFTAIASATDTAKVRACNLSGGSVDLASASYGVQRPTAISASSTINFSAIADGACSTSTFSLTGAASGGRITPGFPAALESGLVGRMHVSASDTVTVQLCNYSGASLDPASGTFSASIL